MISYLGKRLIDIILSLVALIFLSPIFFLIIICIYLFDSGPIFFIQKRIGRRNRIFNLFKFRSMPIGTKNISSEKLSAIKITKIGKILRKTSLDELPQFFNVLIGNMSIVGPRPHMIKENERYSKSVDKFMVRHFVKPGITGLAQVKGFRGEIETDEDIINRVKYDIYYLENWSLILDLNIVFLTAINFLTGHKKAY